jgi:hypothetical protein
MAPEPLVKAAVGAKASPAEDCTKQHQTRLPEDQILSLFSKQKFLCRIFVLGVPGSLHLQLPIIERHSHSL